jgi:hypothetical protein
MSALPLCRQDPPGQVWPSQQICPSPPQRVQWWSGVHVKLSSQVGEPFFMQQSSPLVPHDWQVLVASQTSPEPQMSPGQQGALAMPHF